MKTCHNCNAEMPDDLLFCGKCGQSLEPPKRLCPKCGLELTESMKKFCGKCGADVTVPPPAAAVPQQAVAPPPQATPAPAQQAYAPPPIAETPQPRSKAKKIRNIILTIVALAASVSMVAVGWDIVSSIYAKSGERLVGYILQIAGVLLGGFIVIKVVKNVFFKKKQ